MRYVSASQSDVGRKRKLNEDRVLERPDCGLWVVADGMGGHDAGEVASAAIVDALAAISEEPNLELLVASAIDALHEVNARLRALARSADRPTTIGSTVVALAISGGTFRCIWAGDSRAYRVRGTEIVQITRDHSLVQDLVAAGLVEPAEAETHPQAHVITRAVGAADELELEGVAGDVQADDIFLLASDGLTRVVPPDEILRTLRTMNPVQAVRALIETVLSRGAPDNVTVAICRVR
ncbi:MAG TPA: protein phosphatase 2C domain-containing protein [Croceibacterium sp.]|nr:protein phosphatase 2C domain-containing protein [Croceibacterium sp.]